MREGGSGFGGEVELGVLRKAVKVDSVVIKILTKYRTQTASILR